MQHQPYKFQSKSCFNFGIEGVLCNALVMLDIDAFVDDTNIIHSDEGDADISEVLWIIQDNFWQWQGLLHASGGMLNPPKCSWTPFKWQYNNLGHAWLTQLPLKTNLQLTANNLEGKWHTLKINKPEDAIWLLGMHIAADRNSMKEISILKQKQNKNIRFLLWTPLSKCEAQVIYNSVTSQQ